jgi:hypothetical protein
LLDTSDHDRMDEEEPSLFHLLKTLRRRNTRAIQRVQDSKGNIANGPQDVANIFLTSYVKILDLCTWTEKIYQHCKTTYNH